MCAKTQPQKIKTMQRPSSAARALREAFVDLLIEEDFSKMSVAQLTRQAGLNRKTFYLHYSSLEHMLNELLDAEMFYFSSYYGYTNPAENDSSDSSSSEPNSRIVLSTDSDLADFVNEKLTSLSLEERQNMLRHVPSSYLIDHMALRIEQNLSFKAKESPTENPAIFFSSLFFTGGTVALYRQWLLHGQDMTPSQFVPMVQRLVINGLLKQPSIFDN